MQRASLVVTHLNPSQSGRGDHDAAETHLERSLLRATTRRLSDRDIPVVAGNPPGRGGGARGVRHGAAAAGLRGAVRRGAQGSGAVVAGRGVGVEPAGSGEAAAPLGRRAGGVASGCAFPVGVEDVAGDVRPERGAQGSGVGAPEPPRPLTAKRPPSQLVTGSEGVGPGLLTLAGFRFRGPTDSTGEVAAPRACPTTEWMAGFEPAPTPPSGPLYPLSYIRTQSSVPGGE